METPSQSNLDPPLIDFNLLSPPQYNSNSTPQQPSPSIPPPKGKRTLPAGPQPSPKRASVNLPSSMTTSEELGELIMRDVELLSSVGWRSFVKHRRGRGDFSSLDNVNHPARRLLMNLKHRGAPVKFTTPPWTTEQIDKAIRRGPHKSCNEYIDFLDEEFIDMIRKGQWVILPASVAKKLVGLRVSPPGVVPQRDRRPRWICDYTWSGVNLETIRLALTAAETGHLVLATLHTASAPQAIDRLVDAFPSGEKEGVRNLFAESLVGVLAQTLCPHACGTGRVAAHEVMVGTTAVRNLIREGKVAQLYSQLQTGQAAGMQTLDQSLMKLYRSQKINQATLLELSKYPQNLNLMDNLPPEPFPLS